MALLRSTLLLTSLVTVSCSLAPFEPEVGHDAGPRADAGPGNTAPSDSGTAPDAGPGVVSPTDAGSTDAGSTDAGSTDAGSTDAGSPMDAGPDCSGPEICDGADQDCDGAVDEDVAPRSCTTSCGTPGIESCSAGGFGPCLDPMRTERCDGADDDCDGTIDEGDVCPCVTDHHDGSTYLFCPDSQVWDTAQIECRRLGYDLVTIESSVENDWLGLTAAGVQGGVWWIGLRRAADGASFSWSSSSPSTYRNWAPLQPGPGDCASMTPRRFLWESQSCEFNAPYICEAR